MITSSPQRNPRALRLTDAQENQIRHEIFKLGRDPREVCKAHGIRLDRLRKICCGTIPGLSTRKGIEGVYQ